MMLSDHWVDMPFFSVSRLTVEPSSLDSVTKGMALWKKQYGNYNAYIYLVAIDKRLSLAIYTKNR